MNRLFSFGDCDANLRIYRNGACFKTSYNGYQDDDTCTIYVLADCELEVNSFDTELDYDTLSVNGILYSGSMGPDGVWVAEGEEITFSADDSTTGSFDICGSPSPAPTDNELLLDIENLGIYLIIAGFFLLACIVLYVVHKMSKKHKRKIWQDVEGGQELWQRMQRGEVRRPSEKSIHQPQSVEGTVEVVEFNPQVELVKNGALASNSSSIHSDRRPIFSLNESYSEQPLPDFETESSSNVIENQPGEEIQDISEQAHLDLAPPALAPPDLAPPEWEAPPPYEPVEELEGAVAKRGAVRSF